jgi:hypothetical protein
MAILGQLLSRYNLKVNWAWLIIITSVLLPIGSQCKRKKLDVNSPRNSVRLRLTASARQARQRKKPMAVFSLACARTNNHHRQHPQTRLLKLSLRQPHPMAREVGSNHSIK